jgi:hypothetical protein
MSETRCEVPPAGWWCSRVPVHDGPCAAREAAWHLRKRRREWIRRMLRRWRTPLQMVLMLSEVIVSPTMGMKPGGRLARGKP